MHASRCHAALLALLLIAVGCSQSKPAGDVTQAGAEKAAAPDSAQVTAAVNAAVDAHWKAINEMDTLAIAAHHTPDITFFGVESSGRVVLGEQTPEMAALWKRFRGARSQWKPRDVQVRVLGNVAVATFYNDGSITYADGTVDKGPRLVTEVWVLQPDGKWLEAHHHDSRASQ